METIICALIIIETQLTIRTERNIFILLNGKRELGFMLI